MATDRLINKDQGDSMISALGTIATNVGNITYGPQTSADKVVSMTGYAKAGTAAAISQGDTLNEAIGKLEKKVDDNATAIDGKTAGPESATVGDIATFNNVNGKVLNDSGISIQTSIDTTKDTEVPTSKAVDTYVTGKGYAVGVANSTANHLVTFNGTDGKALKDGGATIAFNATGVLDDDTAIPTSKAVQSYVTGKHYAGSSSDGGAATSADKLNIGSSNIGSATQPVYFDNTTGKPVAITNTIQSNVPANAVFTDTTYTVAEGTANGKIKVTPSSGTAYEVPVHGLGNAAYKGVADTVSTSADLVTSAAVNTKLASYVPNSDFVVAEQNIVYTLGKTGKNLFNSSDTFTTPTGLTITKNTDGAFTVSGTSTTAVNVNLGTITLDATKTYVLSGCPTGGDANTYSLLFGTTGYTKRDIGTGITLTNAPANTSLTTYISIGANYTVNKTFYPMICTAEDWAVGHDYVPYALPNSDLTVLEAEDRVALAEEIDAGAKNLLPLDLALMKSRNTGGTWTNNVYKIGNVDITVNSDGTIKLNGTSNNQFEFYIYTRVSDTFKLPVGTYMFYNSLTASTGGNWDIAINRTVSGAGVRYGSDTGNGLLFTVTDSSATTGVWIACNVSGTVFNNVTIKPMICTKAAFGVSSKFVPYRPNYDLVCNSIDDLYIRSTTKFPASARTSFELTIASYKDSGRGSFLISFTSQSVNSYVPSLYYVAVADGHFGAPVALVPNSEVVTAVTRTSDNTKLQFTVIGNTWAEPILMPLIDSGCNLKFSATWT